MAGIKFQTRSRNDHIILSAVQEHKIFVPINFYTGIYAVKILIPFYILQKCKCLFAQWYNPVCMICFEASGFKAVFATFYLVAV